MTDGKAKHLFEAAKMLKEEAGDAVVVAATKTQPPETVNLLKECGISIAGENRVQEFLEKYPLVTGIEWHFIGRLQTNKVKYIVDKVTMIQSVDREALAREIEKECEKKDVIMNVLLEFNAGEASKGGAAETDLFALADYVEGLKHLRLKGLMCVPPVGIGEEIYAHIRDLHLRLKQQYPEAGYLSVGMSGDYKTALKYGANMIRPGSLLFGQRH